MDNWKPDLERFADQVNCKNCTRGTQIQVLRPYPQCRNVFPTPIDHEPKTCLDAIHDRTTDDAVNHGTYVVQWRYTTNGNQFVMVRDKHPNDARSGVWVFMDRRAFRQNLCTPLSTRKYDCGDV